MKLPHLFRQIHGDAIYAAWMRLDQAPIVRVIPQEPLGAVDLTAGPDTMPDGPVVTVVTVRCRNDRGVLAYEAASPTDLKVAQEWAKRHKDTPVEKFTWVPQF